MYHRLLSTSAASLLIYGIILFPMWKKLMEIDQSVQSYLFVLFKSFDKECSNMFSGLFQKRRVQDIMIEFDIIDTKSERFIAT
jgi:hypothetical protein